MTGDHFEDDELLAYLDADDERELARVREHMDLCDRDCRERLEWLQGFADLLRDKEIHRFAQRSGSGGPTNERVAEASALTAQRTAEDTEGTAWAAGLVRRMLHEARAEFDRRPKVALQILTEAERLARTLSGTREQAEHRGAIAKELAEALRMLGRHAEALSALDSAEEFLARIPAPGYDLAFVDWIRAAVLFYLTRYDDALPFARRAGRVFREHGDIERAQQVRMVEANILCERGDVGEAHRIFTRLVIFFQGDDDREMVARLHANLAECEVRLDHTDVAYEYAEDAMGIYGELGLQTEKVRVRWILGYALMRKGRPHEALNELQAAADGFLECGMVDAAAAVGLDIAELHLSRSEWLQAEQLSRRLANQFTAIGAPLHAARAFAYLREAAGAGSATVQLVDYLRSYLASVTGDESVRFEPPAN
ncbi:MAG TPA: hypothetical protein VFP80_12515 [Thermoanaerobaculia bacterium]|nr:hypothetical protein [Thermoanaerobaculia bacterium]